MSLELHPTPMGPQVGADEDWQPYVWGIIRVPYGNVEMDDRADDVDEVIMAALAKLAERFPGAETHCLDHVGVGDWMKEVVMVGLVRG